MSNKYTNKGMVLLSLLIFITVVSLFALDLLSAMVINKKMTQQNLQHQIQYYDDQQRILNKVRDTEPRPEWLGFIPYTAIYKETRGLEYYRRQEGDICSVFTKVPRLDNNLAKKNEDKLLLSHFEIDSAHIQSVWFVDSKRQNKIDKIYYLNYDLTLWCREVFSLQNISPPYKIYEFTNAPLDIMFTWGMDYYEILIYVLSKGELYYLNADKSLSHHILKSVLINPSYKNFLICKNHLILEAAQDVPSAIYGLHSLKWQGLLQNYSHMTTLPWDEGLVSLRKT